MRFYVENENMIGNFCWFKYLYLEMYVFDEFYKVYRINLFIMVKYLFYKFKLNVLICYDVVKDLII